MTKAEVENLSKWMMQLWQTYMKYLKLEMAAGDFDAVVEELRAIWEDSGENQLIMDMSTAFANDLDRRAKHASNEA